MKQRHNDIEAIDCHPVHVGAGDFCCTCNKLVHCIKDNRFNPRCPECNKIVWEAAARGGWMWSHPPIEKKEAHAQQFIAEVVLPAENRYFHGEGEAGPACLPDDPQLGGQETTSDSDAGGVS